MKSTIALLSGGTAVPKAVKPPQRKRKVEDDDHLQYMEQLKGGDMSTVELAQEFDVTPNLALRRLCRLEKRGAVKRVGTEKSGGHRETVIWSLKPAPYTADHHRTDAALLDIVRSRSRNTEQIAAMVHMQYYTVLDRLKQLEAAGTIRRVGIDRLTPTHPHIKWEVVK